MYGEIDETTKDIKLEFVQIDNKEFVEKEVEVSNISSVEEIIEKINGADYDANKYYKLILVGNKKIEINTNQILKNVISENVIKIKDKTKLALDLESLSKQNNLKGIFVRNLLQEFEANPEEKEKIMKAIELGLASF